MIEQTLHGLVVGLGKIRKDGSKEFRWLEKPIHNRIVSGGLDEYFMCNGSATTIPRFPEYYQGRFYCSNSQNSPYRYFGMLRYIAIGTDGTPTEFTDTGLKEQVGGYSSNYSYPYLPFFATRITPPNKVSFRVQSTSIAVPDDTTVREIGWFEKYDGAETYTMFSRVVLPSPVELLAGESLTVVYQMEVTYSNVDEVETPSALISGLLDSDGNPLRGRSSYRLCTNTSLQTNTWILPDNPSCTFFGIKKYSTYAPDMFYGYANISVYALTSIFDASVKGSYGGAPNVGNAFNYTTSSTWQLSVPQFGVVTNRSLDIMSQANNTRCSCTIKPYVIGSYYRDKEFTLYPSWPDVDEVGQYSDIYAICCNSHLTRFGYMDNTDPSNPVWVPKPWRKKFGQSYKFTFRYKLSTADTV